MHPTTLFLSLAALASVAVSTQDRDYGPRCPEDEYYNTMMESKNRKAAVTDCAKWLGATITNPTEIPKYLKDCGGDKDEDRVSRVSAACSCIETSSVPPTSSTSTHVSSTTSSTAVITTSSRTSSYQPSSSSTLVYHVYPIVQQPSAVGLFGFNARDIFHNLEPQGASNGFVVITIKPQHKQQYRACHHFIVAISHLNLGSTATAPGSTDTSVAPEKTSTTSFTTSTIYTKSIYTITSCAPDQPDCPAASTVLVTSTIPISTTICPVTGTPRPTASSKQTTTQWTTTTIYSTSTYTLTRCPPGATNCPVDNLPITTRIPVSSTVLPVADSDTKKEATTTQPGVSDGDHGKPDVASTTFTVVTVPTTIHTIMNGVSAQILTVIPVTSAIGVANNADSAPQPSSTADTDPHANSGAGKEPLSATHDPSHPHAAPTDAPFESTTWKPTEPSRSGLTSKPILPANNTPVTSSTSSRPPVVTAGAPGLVGSDGMRVAFLVFALAALL